MDNLVPAGFEPVQSGVPAGFEPVLSPTTVRIGKPGEADGWVPGGFEPIEGLNFPDPNNRTFAERWLKDPIRRGKNNQLDALANTTGLISGAISPEQWRAAFVRDYLEAQQYPMQNDVAATMQGIKEAGEKSWSDLGGYAWDNLGGVSKAALQVATESLPATGAVFAGGAGGAKTGALAGGAAGTLAGPAGTAVGSAAGGLGGFMAGAGATSMAIDASAKFNEAIIAEMQKRGVPITEEYLGLLMQDEAFVSDAKTRALKHGAAVGALDALTVGLVGRFAGPVSRAVSGSAPSAGRAAAGRGAGFGAELGVQAGGGAGGEALGQYWADGKITDRADILMEALGEIAGAGVEIPGTVAARTMALGRPAMPQITNTPTDAISTAAEQIAAPAPAPQAPVDQSEVPAGFEPVASAPIRTPAPAPVQSEVPEGFEPIAAPAPMPAPTMDAEPQLPMGQPPVVEPAIEPAPVTMPAPQVLPRPTGKTAVEATAFPAGPGATMGTLNTNPSTANAMPPPPAPSSPPVQAPAPAPTRQSRVSTPDGEHTYNTEFQVVDAAALQQATGDLQPRDRANRIGSEMQIDEIAFRLNPDLLIDSPQSDRGAPIIDENNTVLSGNGRVAALARALHSNPDAIAAYRARIEAEGFDVSGVQNPVLVRRLDGLTPDQKRDFVTRSNRDDKLSMGTSEEARVDADMLTPGVVSLLNPESNGGIGAAENAGFVRAFINGLPTNQINDFTKDGRTLTAKGAMRVEAAVFSRAYGDKELTDKIIETNSERAGTRNALLAAAPAWLQMRTNAPSQFDVTQALVDAINAMADLNRRGQSLQQFFQQKDAFAQPQPLRDAILKGFYTPTMNRPIAWRDARDFLRDYAQRAEKQANASDDIFNQPVTPQQILDALVVERNKKIQKRGENAPADEAPIAAGAPAANPSAEMIDRQESITRSRDRADRAVQTDSADQTEYSSADKSFEDARDTRAPVTRRDAQTDLLGPLDDQPAARGGMNDRRERTAFDRSSENRGPPASESAFAAMGLAPDVGVNLPPAVQVARLKDVLKSNFGFKDIKTDGANVRDVLDQMLNAHENLRWMAHALKVPPSAFSLNGEVTLNLQPKTKKTRHFGVYNPSDKSIGLPGRSNSFAHEWAHALDHHLAEVLAGKNTASMLSLLGRRKGLDPSDSLGAAFANLLNKLFFQHAPLAAQVLNLQKTIAENSDVNGNINSNAGREAQAELDAITRGNRRLEKGPASDYLQTSKEYGEAMGKEAYYTNPAEMLARAFEAYAAHKVEGVAADAGATSTNAFVSKGEQAYLDDADARLSRAFPKAGQRYAIFNAFDEVFDHLRAQAVFGPGAPASAPDVSDITDPHRWTKLAAQRPMPTLVQDIQREIGIIKNSVDRIVSGDARGVLGDVKAAMDERTGSDGKSARRIGSTIVGQAQKTFLTIRGNLRILEKVVPDAARPYVAALNDKTFDVAGSGRSVIDPYEKHVRRHSRQDLSAIGDLLKAHDFGHFKTGSAEANTVREIMLGKNPANADKRLVAVAAGLRRLLDNAFRALRDAGVDVGYVQNTGYFTRLLDVDAVQSNPEKFLAQATKTYSDQFNKIAGLDAGAINHDNLKELVAELRGKAEVGLPPSVELTLENYRSAEREVRKAEKAMRQPGAGKVEAALLARAEAALDKAGETLAAAARPAWAGVNAVRWQEAILSGDPIGGASSASSKPSFTKGRTLPASADDHMADFFHKNPIDMTAQYLHQTTRKLAQLERYGNTGLSSPEATDVDQAAKRPEVEAAMLSNPKKYTLATPTGRLAIMNDLLDRNTHNLLEMHLKEGQRAGMTIEQLDTARYFLGVVTGAGARDARGTPVSQRALAYLYAAGTIALLPRALWTALAEPTTALLRTGSVSASLQTLGAYLREAVRTAQSVRELDALSRAMGITTDAYFEAILNHSMAAQNADSAGTVRFLSSFFMRTGLTGLTNAQKRAAIAGGTVWFKDLAGSIIAPKDGWARSSSMREKLARSEFVELGVAPADVDSFAQWLLDLKGKRPSLDDLNSVHGETFARALHRLNEHIIQEPTRADKPVYAAHPVGRMVFAIQGFIYAFSTSQHMRIARTFVRDFEHQRGEGAGKFEAIAKTAPQIILQAIAGFGAIFVGQLIAAVAREALFNGDSWDDKEKKGELRSWLSQLALSRSGWLGPIDTLYQAYTGLRYERDLTALATGAHLGFFLNSGLQPLFQAMTGRNSTKTNTAERKQAKALYNLFAVPLINYALTALPGGPMAGAAYGFGMQKLTSNSAADAFATAVVGPKPPARRKQQQ